MTFVLFFVCVLSRSCTQVTRFLLSAPYLDDTPRLGCVQVGNQVLIGTSLPKRSFKATTLQQPVTARCRGFAHRQLVSQLTDIKDI